ncbi:MAG: TM2 domain-containing protein [Chloroflexi bacterium]|nr:TM2 domain-containing protein [Chloroflexota bacterium]
MVDFQSKKPKEVSNMERKEEWQRQLTILIISFLAGYFGLDRFYRGQIGWGIIKMITVGGAGIWYLVDLAIAAYRLGKLG